MLQIVFTHTKTIYIYIYHIYFILIDGNGRGQQSLFAKKELRLIFAIIDSHSTLKFEYFCTYDLKLLNVIGFIYYVKYVKSNADLNKLFHSV